MSYKSTPETDAAIFKVYEGPPFSPTVSEVVDPDVSRKLELERDKAQALARELRDALDESNADRLRLREALRKLEFSGTSYHGHPMCSKCLCIPGFDEEHKDDCVFATLATPPPPVVAKADADALAEAIEYTIKVDAILHPETDHVGMRQALETYRSKYPQ
jgi:hypothetical protein